MEIPEIQYQPEAPSANFAPVEQIDYTKTMQANHDRSIRDMNARLQQMDRNAATKLQNVKNQAFPVEALAKFSSTLEGFLQDRIKENKENDLAEGAMLAFTEGMGVDPAFEQNEAAIEQQGSALTRRADMYEMQTGDIETAQQVRDLSGWKKYGYAKAKMDMVGGSFGSWMDSNASNDDYAVNVGGQMYTLANAPNQAVRQAVAAKMASSYMQPYSGMNKSFLAKYLFPKMQRGMSSSVARAAQANAKLMKANRLDGALTSFRGAPTPEGMMELDRVLRLDGYDNATIRGHLTSEMTKVKSNAEFETLMRTPYGPNGQAFEEQYPQEAAELRVARQQYLQRGVQADELELSTQDRQGVIEAKNMVAQERADGSFDANPERIREMATEARAAGLTKTAEYWESQIGETAFMKNSEQVKEQYELQIQAGVVPSEAEILQNPALSQEHKQDLLSKSESTAGGGSSPDSEVAKGHKKIIEAAIRKRGKWIRDGANDPGIPAMELQAWQEYSAIYNREFRANGGNAAMAAQAALNDFKSKFGTDEKTGQYGLQQAEPGVDPQRVGKYSGYDPTGVASTTVNPMQQIREKTQGPGAFQTIGQALTQPDLYSGEDVQLRDLQRSFTTTGKIGTIPSVYYDLQQQLGGEMSIMDMINMRLKANGLDELPKELNNTLKPVEQTFDEETYKYISYKPNATRTDIGLISSGQEPIYSTSLPTNVASDTAFQQEVSAVAGRLGISEADLYAVMSFETGGTFNPGIRNAAGSGATGLIQFMPSTAAGLGTSTDALSRMSRVDQMQYVEKYLSNKGVKGGNLSDLYMAVLFPAAVGKPDNFVLFGNGATIPGYGAGTSAYSQNRGLDSNGDGSITKAEASAKVLRHRHPQPWRRPNNMRPELQ
jgi:hypothetical protein